MRALPPPPHQSQDALLQARIETLSQHGYIACEQGKWCLTELGWRTLSAAADAPTAPHRPTRLQLANELLEQGLTFHLAGKMLHRG